MKRNIRNFKKFLYKIFWIDEFQDKSKLCTFIAKFFMYVYIMSIISNLILFIISRDISSLIFACLIIVIAPFIYRFVMGVQRYIHKI
ncbi:hypothetical protein ACFIJ5_16200 [Haloimpatiens sp. FM7330]|uniref:hypothetical protein n=1 Tax=Haloimpatiens sp. FM7330 TaxID=3298610 RepID=UPI00363E9F58